MVWLHVPGSPNTFLFGSVPPCALSLPEVLSYCATLCGLVLAKALSMELVCVLQLLQETVTDRSTLVQFSISVFSVLLSFLTATVRVCFCDLDFFFFPVVAI